MPEASKSIDIKSLVLYSLILVAVIIASFIFIKLPAKKTANNTAPTVQPTQTEADAGSQLNKVKEGWQLYQGATFNVAYPQGYTSSVSSTYDLASFTSPDSTSILTVYFPEKPSATSSEFTVNEEKEDIVNNISGKNPTCDAQVCTREITFVEAKDKSYAKRIVINQNNAKKTTSAFIYQYKFGTPDTEISDIFNYFQQTLVRSVQ